MIDAREWLETRRYCRKARSLLRWIAADEKTCRQLAVRKSWRSAAANRLASRLLREVKEENKSMLRRFVP